MNIASLTNRYPRIELIRLELVLFERWCGELFLRAPCMVHDVLRGDWNILHMLLFLPLHAEFALALTAVSDFIVSQCIR